MVIPKSPSTNLPTNIKARAITVAVVTDSIITVCFCFLFNPSTREINKGIFPKLSTATKIGINANKNESKVSCFTNK